MRYKWVHVKFTPTTIPIVHPTLCFSPVRSVHHTGNNYPRGPLPILLGTDVGLGFSKHPHSYIQYFWKQYPFIYFRWKSWPNHIFHNSVISNVNAGEKFTAYWYNCMLNYMYIHIDIQIDENCIPLIYLSDQKVDPFQRYVCVYQDIGKPPSNPLGSYYTRQLRTVGIKKNICVDCNQTYPIFHPDPNNFITKFTWYTSGASLPLYCTLLSFTN